MNHNDLVKIIERLSRSHTMYAVKVQSMMTSSDKTFIVIYDLITQDAMLSSWRRIAIVHRDENDILFIENDIIAERLS